MGQRHQIYIFIKDKDNTIHSLAYHNQWCYGTLPLKHLKRFVTYQDKASEFSGIGWGHNEIDEFLINSLLSVDPNEGFYSHYLNDTKDMMTPKGIDPHKGDNNDGITIMYLEDQSKIVKYAFMGVHEGWSGGYKIPLSAREYLRLYHEEGSDKWKNWKLERLVKSLEKKAVLLTAQECVELLPVFYNKKEKEALNIPVEELPVLINNKDFMGHVARMRLGHLKKAARLFNCKGLSNNESPFFYVEAL